MSVSDDFIINTGNAITLQKPLIVEYSQGVQGVGNSPY